MNAVRRVLGLGLALLLAAATAAARTAVVAEEVLPCSVVSAELCQPCARRLDTLAANTSPAEMAARCHEMEQALRECGRSDPIVTALLRDIRNEKGALRGIWPQETANCVSGSFVGLLSGVIGFLVGTALHPPVANSLWFDVGCLGGYDDCGGGIVGCPVGCVAGYLGGVALSEWWRASLIAQHCVRVNDLVRRVNRALAAAP